MPKRKSITKKLRFEVFKRDSFTCQYCGSKAPDVLLELDHMEPVAKGGTNDILNLTTSCKACNAGKSDRRLSDETVLDKKRQQLEELQERKEQKEMMFQWQKGLIDLDDDVIDKLASFWAERSHGYHLNENGLKNLRRLRRKFSVEEIMQAIVIAVEQYLVFEDGEPTEESMEHAWKKVGGICTIRRAEEDDPNTSRLYYIRAILRNRLSYCNEQLALQLLRDAVEWGATLYGLEKVAKSARNWTDWREIVEEFISQAQEGYKRDEDEIEDD